MRKVNYNELKEDGEYIVVILLYTSDGEKVELYGRYNKKEVYNFLENRYEDYFDEEEIEYNEKENNIKLEDDVVGYVNKLLFEEKVEVWEG